MFQVTYHFSFFQNHEIVGLLEEICFPHYIKTGRKKAEKRIRHNRDRKSYKSLETTADIEM